MESHTVRALLERALRDRRLLEHPFYVRWQAGGVSLDELRAYAAQYRHFEVAFPGYLAEVAQRLEDAEARRLVEANLADEVDGPMTHVELFDAFAAAVEADRPVPPTAATRELLSTYGELVASGPETGLAALIAYEVQFPEVALAKAEGLRRDHGLGRAATAFWDVHAELDVDHATCGVEALARVASDHPAVAAAARRAAGAWWDFLDEREASA